MVRSWVLGLFIIGLTGFCVLNAIIERRSPEPKDYAEASAVRTISLRQEAVPAPGDEAAGEAAEVEMAAVGGPESDPAPVAGPEVALADGGTDLRQRLTALADVDVPGGAAEVSSAERLREAEQYIDLAGQAESPVQAARYLTAAIGTGAMAETDDDLAYEQLQVLLKRGFLNPRNREDCYVVEVLAGDSLWKICQRIVREGNPPVAAGLIQLFNRMDSNTVYEGQRLKIPLQPLRILIEKHSYRLNVFVGDILIRRYLIGLGKEDRTPEGDFVIETRQKEPTWYKPGVGPVPFGSEENVLGTRWLGFGATEEFPGAKQFGIHGTWEDHSIGGNFSRGCIRMLNAEVEELFEWVAEGVKVQIAP